MNEKLSRREFLQTACIGIGALSLADGATKAAASSQMLNDSNTSGFPSCDILIIGSGGAGLRAAVAARNLNPNLSVIVATKTMPSRNATCMAEGGINGVTDFSDEDSYELHAYDTIKGGAYLVDQDAALKFCKLASETISEMDYIGTIFSRTDNRKVSQRFMGSASKKDVISQPIKQAISLCTPVLITP